MLASPCHVNTGKVCELLPCPAQSIIQQMEHINRTEGESEPGWGGVGAERVGGGGGVGEHLTQTLFVLMAGVCNTIEPVEEGGGGC